MNKPANYSSDPSGMHVGLVPLESILCTEELNRRPRRPADYETETRAIGALAGALADSPRTILQTLAEKILEVLRADSAGLSLLTKDEKSFYWAAIAGAWKVHLGGGTPRDFGPCGDVLDRNLPLLFSHWERRYPYLSTATPLAEEGLLVPFSVSGKTVGTIWAISHNPLRKFDAEDLRLLESLGRFASAAYQAVESLKHLEEAHAALLRDVEERKTLEEQLLHAQKMESLGVLAGGIAHDFNNILNIIQGYTFLLRAHIDHNQDAAESVDVIHETVQRGSTLVQQLLTLARKSSARFTPVDLNLLIQRLIRIIRETFPKTVELRFFSERDLPLVLADENQLELALLNLSVNARDAMVNRGILTFKTQSVDAAAFRQSIRTGGGNEDRYVSIEVSDTGGGMDERIRQRIFEPFFTTKELGRGTGLGLSVVYGIVTNHKGFIDVESKPGRGTSFRLYFPVSRISSEDTITKSHAEAPQKFAGSPTVLLVEDENRMLNLLENIFLEHGYRVLGASDGDMALEVYRTHKESIDLVLLDMGLPKTAGRDVLVKMKQENPNVKILVASGYLDPELQSEIERAGVSHFLRKPYMPNEALKTARELIESA